MVGREGAAVEQRQVTYLVVNATGRDVVGFSRVRVLRHGVRVCVIGDGGGTSLRWVRLCTSEASFINGGTALMSWVLRWASSRNAELDIVCCGSLVGENCVTHRQLSMRMVALCFFFNPDHRHNPANSSTVSSRRTTPS